MRYAVIFEPDELKLLENIINAQLDDMEDFDCNCDTIVEQLEEILKKVKGGLISSQKW